MNNSWEMDYDHNTYAEGFDHLVEMPFLRDKGVFMKEVFYQVLSYGFAIQYDEGSHALLVQKKDYELINSLVREMEKKNEDCRTCENNDADVAMDSGACIMGHGTCKSPRKNCFDYIRVNNRKR